MSLDEKLQGKGLTLKDIEKYIDYRNIEFCNKILFKIHLFDNNSKKELLLNIIINNEDKSLIDTVCREIYTFVEYEFEYYREIIQRLIEKKINGQWASELKLKIVQDNRNLIQTVLKDFAKKKMKFAKFDIEIVEKLIDNYEEKYLDSIEELSKEEVIIICKKLNYIMSINSLNIIRIVYYIDKMFHFDKKELGDILDKYIFNYPFLAKKFLQKISEEDEPIFFGYLNDRIMRFDNEEKIKNSMENFKPNAIRIVKYRERQMKQNKIINKESEEMSLIANLFRKDIILYGKKVGMNVIKDNKKEMVTSELSEFKSEYYYPREYILDPVEYMLHIKKI